jgi:hypothetical protein
LIDEETGGWNEENVHAFFSVATANQILQTPISRYAEEDFVCWPHTRNGLFSVRSAYNLARSSKFLHAQSRNGRGMNSNWTENEKCWKAIWKIKAPGKMLIHLWRFAHDCLPSGVQLRRRQIPADGTCIFCSRQEGIEHTLLFCQFARVVWQEVKEHIPLHLERKNFSSPKLWLFDFLARSTGLQATTLAVVFWHIWEARNEARNSDVKQHPSRTQGFGYRSGNLVTDR